MTTRAVDLEKLRVALQRMNRDNLLILAALWWASNKERLSSRARRVIMQADRLGVPAIVFW